MERNAIAADGRTSGMAGLDLKGLIGKLNPVC
jgi:hypothetical protein